MYMHQAAGYICCLNIQEKNREVTKPFTGYMYADIIETSCLSDYVVPGSLVPNRLIYVLHVPHSLYSQLQITVYSSIARFQYNVHVLLHVRRILFTQLCCLRCVDACSGL